MTNGRKVEFEDVVVEKETDMALLVRFPEREDPVWIPKSQVHDDSEVFDENENCRGTIALMEWIAVEKGLV